MKIQIDNIVRDMTPEEEAKYFPPADEEEIQPDEALNIILGGGAE
jgi:hypothetical protein